MRVTVTKILTFDAAHSLPEPEGKCRNVHGHTYSPEATVEGSGRRAAPCAGAAPGSLEGVR